MPNNITDVVTYNSPIQTVADGDAASGANFALAPQGLANRTAFLNSILNTTGVTLLRSGTSAAMVALTGVVNGTVFYVLGQGLYVYLTAGALTVDSKFVYTATGMGVGQWQHELVSLLNAGQGIPTLGSVLGSGTPSGKLALSTQTNALVGISKVDFTAGFATTSSSYVDVTGFTTGVTCNTGDILVCHLDACTTDNITGSAYGVAINANATVIAEASGTLPVAFGIVMQNCRSFYIVPSGGTITVKVQMKSSAGGSASINTAPASRLLIEQYRP